MAHFCLGVMPPKAVFGRSLLYMSITSALRNLAPARWIQTGNAIASHTGPFDCSAQYKRSAAACLAG